MEAYTATVHSVLCSSLGILIPSRRDSLYRLNIFCCCLQKSNLNGLKFSVLFLVMIPTSYQDSGGMYVETQKHIFHDKSFRRDFFETFLPSYLQFYKFGGVFSYPWRSVERYLYRVLRFSYFFEKILSLFDECIIFFRWSRSPEAVEPSCHIVQFLSEGASLLPFLQMLAKINQQQKILIVLLTNNSNRILEVSFKS